MSDRMPTEELDLEQELEAALESELQQVSGPPRAVCSVQDDSYMLQGLPSQACRRPLTALPRSGGLIAIRPGVSFAQGVGLPAPHCVSCPGSCLHECLPSCRLRTLSQLLSAASCWPSCVLASKCGNACFFQGLEVLCPPGAESAWHKNPAPCSLVCTAQMA